MSNRRSRGPPPAPAARRRRRRRPEQPALSPPAVLLLVLWALSIFGGVLADSAAAPSNATVDHLPAVVVIGSGLALLHG